MFVYRSITSLLPALALFTLLGVTGESTATTGTICGVVLHKGHRVPDATVNLIRKDFIRNSSRTAPDIGWLSEEMMAGRTRTDGQGRFEIRLPDPIAKATDWSKYRLSVIRGELGNFDPYMGFSRRPCMVDLHPIVTVEGRVRGATSDTIARSTVAIVGVLRNQYPTFEPQPVPVAGDGSFLMHIDGSRPWKRYKCAFSAFSPAGYGGIGPLVPDLINPLGGSSATLGVAIDLRQLVNGRICLADQHGKPLANHRLSIVPNLEFHLGGRKSFYAPFGADGRTNETGVFECENVWPSVHHVFVHGDRYIGRLEMDLTGRTSPFAFTHTVETLDEERYFGTVRDEAGRPIAEVLVEALMFTADGMWSRGESTKTDTDGVYSFTGLPRRPWGIRFLKPGYKEGMRSEDKSDVKGMAPGDWSIRLDEGPFSPKDVKTPSGLTTHQILRNRYEAIMKQLKDKGSWWE